MGQFIPDLRPDEFDPLQMDIRILLGQRSHYPGALFCGGHIFLQGQVDHDILCTTEILNLKIVTESQFPDRATNAFQISGFLVIDFHDCTAGKLDGKMQSLVPQEKDGSQKSDQ